MMVFLFEKKMSFFYPSFTESLSGFQQGLLYLFERSVGRSPPFQKSNLNLRVLSSSEHYIDVEIGGIGYDDQYENSPAFAVSR